MPKPDNDNREPPLLMAPKEAAVATTMSRQLLALMAKEGKFPKPVPLSETRVAYVRARRFWIGFTAEWPREPLSQKTPSRSPERIEMDFSTVESLPEGELQRVIDYAAAAAMLTNGRHDFRIPYFVAEGWARRGYAVLSTNRLADQFGSTRRTMCKSIARMVEAGAIREVGRTDDGRPKYAPCLEIGDAWRAKREAARNER